MGHPKFDYKVRATRPIRQIEMETLRRRSGGAFLPANISFL